MTVRKQVVHSKAVGGADIEMGEKQKWQSVTYDLEGEKTVLLFFDTKLYIRCSNVGIVRDKSKSDLGQNSTIHLQKNMLHLATLATLPTLGAHSC
jgi:hypothetical protein